MSFQTIATPTLDPYEPPVHKQSEPLIGPIGLLPVLLVSLAIFVIALCWWDMGNSRVEIQKNHLGQWERVR